MDINQFEGSWGPQRVDGGCDLCAGVPLAPKDQSCDHRCDGCGRPMQCEHGNVEEEANGPQV